MTERSPLRERAYAVLLAPYLVGLVLLVAVPTIWTVVLAFTEHDLVRPAEWVGIENFRELLDDPIFATSIRNSLLYVAYSVPLRVIGAVALALLLHRRFWGAGTARTAVCLPSLVPDVAYSLLWLWILNPLYGPLNVLLAAIGAPTPRWLTQPGAAQAAVIIMGAFQIGEGFLVAIATRQQIPNEMYEVATLEGAGPLNAFRRITLPLMAPTLVLLLFRDTIFSLQSSFVPALIVTEGGPPPYATTFLPLFVYRNGFEYLRFGYASAATLLMLAVTAVIVFIQYRIVRRWRHALVV